MNGYGISEMFRGETNREHNGLYLWIYWVYIWISTIQKMSRGFEAYGELQARQRRSSLQMNKALPRCLDSRWQRTRWIIFWATLGIDL
jgi:hypothetical protein